jgi:hypothetical protein
MNFYPNFPHLLFDLGKIQNKRSADSAVERLWVPRKSGAGKAIYIYIYIYIYKRYVCMYNSNTLMKLHWSVYHKTTWYLDSKEHPVQFAILPINLSINQTQDAALVTVQWHVTLNNILIGTFNSIFAKCNTALFLCPISVPFQQRSTQYHGHKTIKYKFPSCLAIAKARRQSDYNIAELPSFTDNVMWIGV